MLSGAILATLNLLISPAFGAPQIQIQPIHTTVQLGNTLKLSVTATSSLPLRYEWSSYRHPNYSPAVISGATNATLVLPSLPESMAGYFRVRVFDSSGSVTSTPVQVIVVSHWVTNGQYYLRYRNNVGNRTNRVQWSANLVDWTTFSTGINGLGATHIDTSMASRPQRFYRVVPVL